MKSQTRRDSKGRKTPTLPLLPPTDRETRTEKLLEICVELLELCIASTATIDPAAAWLVTHAKDEVTLSVYGTRRDRPY